MIFLFIGETYYYWPPRYLSSENRNYSRSQSRDNKDYCSISNQNLFGESISGSTNAEFNFKYNSQSLNGKI